MDRTEISEIAHRDHRIAAPISLERARELLGRLAPASGRVLDLGCGYGEWLLALLEMHEGVTGIGVDLALPGAALRSAERRGLTERVDWQQGDAAAWRDGLFDVVLCIGVSHAFGGLDGTLRAIREHLTPGGQVLLGDTIWEVPPSGAAQNALEAGPEDFTDLAGLVARVRQHGYEPSFGHVSTLEEWDDYEWSWTGSLTQWALREAPTEQDRGRALDIARGHRDSWLDGYRGQLGFVTIVLDDVTARS